MGWFRRGVRCLGRSITRRAVFALPENFWKWIQDTAPDVETYEVASIMRAIGKDGMDEKTRSYINFSSAFREWERATRWTAAVKAADEAARDESLESPPRPRSERKISPARGEARHDDDRDDKDLDSESHQRITPEYLERRGRELGL